MDQRNKVKNRRIQITLTYIDKDGNENEEDIELPLNTTIEELKSQIEQTFNLENGILNKKNLRLKQNRDRTTSTLDDNKKTLFDYRVQTGAKINFTILENVGGKINNLSN